ncbi:hypothetical protein ACLKA6_000781 [Drosophila palustris]
MIATTLLTNISQKIYKISYTWTIDKYSLFMEYNSPKGLTTDEILSDDLGALFETKEFADVTIVTADDHKIPAHKTILSARSKVFAAMFRHSMKENAENCVDIYDFSSDVIIELLRFMYTGKAPKIIMYNSKMTFDLLTAADKYQLDRLKAMCARSLSINLSIDTAPIVLKAADLYNMEDLKSKAIRFIKSNIHKIKETNNWKELIKTNRKLVIATFIKEKLQEFNLNDTLSFCVKTFKVNSNEKFFINVCQAPEGTAPMEVSDEELIGILESTTPGSFRVPMSISELRNTKDRSDNSVEVCDIAINPKFLDKIKRSQLFNNFFLQIVAEALSEKYNIQITMHKTIILSNRKFIGTLAAHRVRNDDVKRVEKSGDSSKQPDQISASGQLVQEIDEEHATNIRNTWMKNREPIYKLRARIRDEAVDEIYAELYLPNCVSSQEFSLDIGEDRILIESLKHGIQDASSTHSCS